MTTLQDMLPANVRKAGRTSLLAGAALFAVAVLGAFLTDGQFFRSYLYAWLFWSGIAVGSLGLLMLHHMTSGAWSFSIQRILEAAVRTLPLVSILFIPIIVGMSHLYPWTDEAYVNASHVVHNKAAYLNTPFFIARAVLYFLIWNFLGWRLLRLGAEMDRTGDPTILRKLRVTSGPGLVVFVFVGTFAVTDWMMSLEPAWFSTIFGFHYVVGTVLTTLSFSVIILGMLSKLPVYEGRLGKKVLLDLGNMTMAFVVLWAYMSFSQLLIIWAGNLPEEIPWYVKRLNGGWGIIATMLAVVQFFAPFFLLLMRQSKSRLHVFMRIAAVIIVMRLFDYFWLVMPSFFPSGLTVHWLDLVLPLAIGGVWFGFYINRLNGAPLLAQRDPRFDLAAQGHAHGHADGAMEGAS